jgi:hypothetical protein
MCPSSKHFPPTPTVLFIENTPNPLGLERWLYFPLLCTQKYFLSWVASHSPYQIEQGLTILFITTGAAVGEFFPNPFLSFTNCIHTRICLSIELKVVFVLNPRLLCINAISYMVTSQSNNITVSEENACIINCHANYSSIDSESSLHMHRSIFLKSLFYLFIYSTSHIILCMFLFIRARICKQL